jgi:hypothetical protein
MRKNIGLFLGIMGAMFMNSQSGMTADFMPNITFVGGRGSGTPMYIPSKHPIQTYAQQKRRAKKRNNIRKFNS